MRKQPNTGSWSRRRDSSPERKKDPFHNGQTPVCEELLHAIQDIFPELRTEEQTNTKTTTTTATSSELGKLLRWQFVSNRKARRVTSPSSTKKKKKKKKKKKNSVEKTDVRLLMGDEQSDLNHNNELDGSDEKSLDQSLPNLDSLSPDFSSDVHNNNNNNIGGSTTNPMNSSTYFFDQIQPQNQTEDLLSPTKFIKLIQPQATGDILSALAAPDLDEEGNDHQEQQQPQETTPDSIIASIRPEGSLSSSVTPSQSQTDMNGNKIDSPTHEWVPRDSAKPQEETPPGEAIKDPLTLPFLLTLSEDNSMTTTTIDGSLTSSLHARDEEPDKLETTRILFEEWLEQLDHDRMEDRGDDYKSFIDFLDDKLQSGHQPIGIPFQKLQDACSNIGCYTCRKEATKELEKLKAKGPVMVLNSHCLREESKAKIDANVESAYDYIALEEGHHTPKPIVEEEDEPDLDVSLSFVMTEPKSKGNGPVEKPKLFLQAATKLHLDNLAEVWLPCGIEEDVMVTTAVQDENNQFLGREAPIILSSEELTVMQENILDNEKDVRDSLDEAQKMRDDLAKELDTDPYSDSQSRSNIEFKTYPLLKQNDETCTEHMYDLFQILEDTTKEVGQEFADLHFYLWTSYLGALDKALKACHSYYSQIEEFADQRGVLPKMFVSADMRGLFKILVEEKCKAWTGFCDVLTKHWSGRLLKEYCTRSYWRGTKSVSYTKLSKLDEDCFSLIKELTDWTETILGKRMGEIMKVRQTHTITMLDMLLAIVDPLAKEYETVERYFSTERNVYFANLRSQIVLVGGVKKRMRLLDEEEVQNMAMGVILMWRHTRIMQDRMIKSKEIPSLPLQLKRWMLQDDRGYDEWRNPTTNATAVAHHHTYCSAGVGGKRRVMCVLAGFAYEWLGQRCKEWKAEMAEKELLIDFMADASAFAGTNGENNKSSKKKKKKKKRVPVASSNILDNDIPKTTESADPSPGEENDSNSSDDETKEETSFAQFDEISNVNKGTRIDSVESLETTDNEAKDDVPETESLKKLSPKPFNVDDFPTSVYVQDDKDMISGKDFLVGRLLDLLQNTTAGNSIVVVQQ